LTVFGHAYSNAQGRFWKGCLNDWEYHATEVYGDANEKYGSIKPKSVVGFVDSLTL
jgi:hypothetical protein